MVECPDCNSELEAVRGFNPDVFGDGEENPICNYVCRNEDCKGWYCNYCERYHPFGTTCSVALVRVGRSEDDGMSWGDNRGRRLYQKLNPLQYSEGKETSE